MNDHSYINASEIAEYTFCPRAWGLKKRGHRSKNQQAMDDGTAFHRGFGRREQLSRVISVLLGIIFLCLLLLLIRYFLK